jgi:hypothetical protein
MAVRSVTCFKPARFHDRDRISAFAPTDFKQVLQSCPKSCRPRSDRGSRRVAKPISGGPRDVPALFVEAPGKVIDDPVGGSP